MSNGSPRAARPVAHRGYRGFGARVQCPPRRQRSQDRGRPSQLTSGQRRKPPHEPGLRRASSSPATAHGAPRQAAQQTPDAAQRACRIQRSARPASPRGSHWLVQARANPLSSWYHVRAPRCHRSAAAWPRRRSTEGGTRRRARDNGTRDRHQDRARDSHDRPRRLRSAPAAARKRRRAYARPPHRRPHHAVATRQCSALAIGRQGQGQRALASLSARLDRLPHWCARRGDRSPQPVRPPDASPQARTAPGRKKRSLRAADAQRTPLARKTPARTVRR